MMVRVLRIANYEIREFVALMPRIPLTLHTGYSLLGFI